MVLNSLGKTIQAITRMVEGRINKAGRDAGFAKTTLYVLLPHNHSYADNILVLSVR